MHNHGERKTDRRTLYTQKVIREAYAQAYQNSASEKISVAQICKLAEINRSTFYLHYSDIESLHSEIENEIANSIFAYINEAWADESTRLDLANVLQETMQDNLVYHRMFTGRLSTSLLNRIVEYAKNIMVHACLQSKQLPEREAEIWAIFIINGALAVCLDSQNRGFVDVKKDNAFTDKLMALASSVMDMEKLNEAVRTYITAGQ